MEGINLSLVDHLSPATPFVDPSVTPSLATNALASIGTTADHSSTPLIGGAPLSLVDPSAIPSFITDVSIVIDHSATPPINVAHINGDPNAQLPGVMSTLSTAVTISAAMSNMDNEELNPATHTSPSNVPTNAVGGIAEKGPTGMTKKAGIMRPNSHSKTAR
jgi:hypothetical protein